MLPKLLMLASPFIVFVLALATSPATAGRMAGTVVGSIADPVVALGMVAAAVLASTGLRWYFGMAAGLLAATVHIAMAYGWWQQIAGASGAQRQAVFVIIMDTALALYVFLAAQTVRLAVAKPDTPIVKS